MHIEPGLVDGTKIVLSYATAALSLAHAGRLAWQAVRQHGTLAHGLLALGLRAALATAAVFCFFELMWHHPVGVSEVHLILGTTLMLVLGVAPAAIGLAAGLLIQGLFFAPADLPQYGMNVTTLLVPLFAMAALARRVIPEHMAYVDLRYGQALKLSLAYQGSIVAWVAFWALYGGGLGADNLAQVARFGSAYMGVVLLEPVADLGVLALAKWLHGLKGSPAVEPRLYQAQPAA
jgi:ABC-type Co2+ transport system permease subunit